MEKFHFFDSAATTPCCPEAAEVLKIYSTEEFGNPSSAHALGQRAAKAIREARLYFAETFKVDPAQVIFTGGGSESDNMAVQGVAMDAFVRYLNKKLPMPPRVICSAVEHPAVKKPVEALAAFGIETVFAAVRADGQIDEDALLEQVTPNTALVSVHLVNNIMGAVYPVEDLAKKVKAKAPQALFHTDAVQGFGRVEVPTGGSPVDLVSISAHKVYGPKGVGALIVLNPELLKKGFRPLVWGGEQEGGVRGGTQNAGLIGGFHIAARQTLEKRLASNEKAERLKNYLKEKLQKADLLKPQDKGSTLLWNSPADAVPHVVSLSVPGFPTGPLAKLLEERKVIISTGSACSSQKIEPDHVLLAMGLPASAYNSMLRISFCNSNEKEDVDVLVDALSESIDRMKLLLGGRR